MMRTQTIVSIRTATMLLALGIGALSTIEGHAQIDIGPNNIVSSGVYNSVAGGDYNTNLAGGITFIGAGNFNFIDDTLWGAFIGSGYANRIKYYANYSFIGGGVNNEISNAYSAVIVGGLLNTNLATFSVIGGGRENHIKNEDGFANSITIAGGYRNTAGSSATAIGGGFDNIASGSSSAIAGGGRNTASGVFSVVPGGASALASHWGQMAFSSGGFTNTFTDRGKAQTSVFVVRNVTTGTNLTELFLDGPLPFGNLHRITIPDGATWAFEMLMVARSSTGASSGWQVKGVIENVGGTTTRIGTFSKTVLGEDVTSWALTIDADNVNDCLSVKVTGAASTTIRWVATVRTSEVSF